MFSMTKFGFRDIVESIREIQKWLKFEADSEISRDLSRHVIFPTLEMLKLDVRNVETKNL